MISQGNEIDIFSILKLIRTIRTLLFLKVFASKAQIFKNSKKQGFQSKELGSIGEKYRMLQIHKYLSQEWLKIKCLAVFVACLSWWHTIYEEFVLN